jgi:hypothetical protein
MLKKNEEARARQIAYDPPSVFTPPMSFVKQTLERNTNYEHMLRTSIRQTHKKILGETVVEVFCRNNILQYIEKTHNYE